MLFSHKYFNAIGILNRLKYILPTDIEIMMYNSLILSHINYGILMWGYHSCRLYKLQKRAMRTITLAPYNAHSEPLFRSLNILKISDIFTLFQLKFYHKLINNKLPSYFTNMQFEQNQNIHRYNTRGRININLPKINHSFAKRCIRYSLPIKGPKLYHSTISLCSGIIMRTLEIWQISFPLSESEPTHATNRWHHKS